MPLEIKEFVDIFNATRDIIKLRRTKGAKYAITLEGGKKPPFRLLYNLLGNKLKVL